MWYQLRRGGLGRNPSWPAPRKRWQAHRRRFADLGERYLSTKLFQSDFRDLTCCINTIGQHLLPGFFDLSLDYSCTVIMFI